MMNRSQKTKKSKKGPARRRRKPATKGKRFLGPSSPSTVVNRQLDVPNRLVQKFRWIETPALQFNVAQAVQGNFYGANTMITMRVGGGNAVVPYFTNTALNYCGARVLKSKIIVEYVNHDTIPFTMLVTPVPTTNTMATTANYQYALNGKFTKTRMVPTLGTSGAKGTITNTITGVNFFGEDYRTSPDYCMGDGVPDSVSSDPATQMYWLLAVSGGTTSFTVTTGGVFIKTTIVNLVEFFEPDAAGGYSFLDLNPERPSEYLPGRAPVRPARGKHLVPCDVSSSRTRAPVSRSRSLS